MGTNPFDVWLDGRQLGEDEYQKLWECWHAACCHCMKVAEGTYEGCHYTDDDPYGTEFYGQNTAIEIARQLELP
jgi:hypothetical protein